VDVAGHDQTHLRVPLDDLPEGRRPLERHEVHPPDPRLERRVVHEHQRRPAGRLAQHRVEPLDAFVRQHAVVAIGVRRVEADEADGVLVDDIAHVTVGQVRR
jgi:hypothetical protein